MATPRDSRPLDFLQEQERIERLMARNRLTVADTARLLGVRRQTVERCRSGKGVQGAIGRLIWLLDTVPGLYEKVQGPWGVHTRGRGRPRTP